MQIIKSKGHCYAVLDWTDCPYWLKPLADNGVSKCNLFGMGVRKEASKSLHICNVVYGKDYEGEV